MEKLNLFGMAFDHGWRYYLRRPHKIFREIKCCVKWSYQRIVRGYADCDVWDMGYHLLRLIPSMLRKLADTSQTTPVLPPHDTEEKWKEWLRQTAANLDSCLEDNVESENPYYEKFMDPAFDLDSEEGKKISELYFEKNKEQWEAARTRLRETFTELGEYLYELWD